MFDNATLAKLNEVEVGRRASRVIVPVLTTEEFTQRQKEKAEVIDAYVSVIRQAEDGLRALGADIRPLAVISRSIPLSEQEKEDAKARVKAHLAEYSPVYTQDDCPSCGDLVDSEGYCGCDSVTGNPYG